MDGKTVKQLLIALGAAAVVAIAWAAWRMSESGGAAKAVPWAGNSIWWGKPAVNAVDVGWTRDALPFGHPIYRQQLPGVTRDGLSQFGWSWVSDPPSEEGLGYE
jgi:hypothetical protein